jgi:hypothetical protein
MSLLSLVHDYVQRLPTADLYVVNPLRHLAVFGFHGDDLPKLRVLAPNLYAIGAVGIIVRYGKRADLDRLRRASARTIVYVVDDDFSAGAQDPNLPERYRARLAAFAEGDWPALRDAADHVIVPSRILAAEYGQRAQIMMPVWHRPPARTDHFQASRFTEIAHLGTGSHRADLSPIANMLAYVLDNHPDVRLTLFAGNEVPDPLRGHTRVRSRPPMRWWRYRSALPRMRFHLALYPLQDTPFNRARSANKLFEHALTGAASLMSPMPALTEAAGELTGIFVSGDASEWRERVDADLADRDRMRRRSEAVRARIHALDPAGAAAQIWLKILSEVAD